MYLDNPTNAMTGSGKDMRLDCRHYNSKDVLGADVKVKPVPLERAAGNHFSLVHLNKNHVAPAPSYNLGGKQL